MITQGVKLKRKEEKRIEAGHRWVFSNEILEISGSPEAGSVVEVWRHDGRSLGFGFFNPSSLIAVRVFSATDPAADEGFFSTRLREAADLRERIYPGSTAYRLVHGESDGLPGLIVDRYGDCFAVQTLSLGMDRRMDLICDALIEIFQPRCIVERNESHLRQLEGLPIRSGILRGGLDGPVRIQEADLILEVDPRGGQKTGFYFDQRENRLACRRLASGARVLDAYCNIGGFGLHMALGGAASVLGIDGSEPAVRQAERCAELNEVGDRCRFSAERLPGALDRLAGEGARFDVVILDPPSMTRNRKAVPAARRAYVDLHRKAIRLVEPRGFLATASCSHHVTDETFRRCIEDAASSEGRSLKLLDWRSQAPDHPVLPAMPETRYLKFALLQVV